MKKTYFSGIKCFEYTLAYKNFRSDISYILFTKSYVLLFTMYILFTKRYVDQCELLLDIRLRQLRENSVTNNKLFIILYIRCLQNRQYDAFKSFRPGVSPNVFKVYYALFALHMDVNISELVTNAWSQHLRKT